MALQTAKLRTTKTVNQMVACMPKDNTLHTEYVPTYVTDLSFA